MGIIAKTEETVVGTAPRVVAALGRLKFLLVGIPIICVVGALLTQTVTSERNLGTVVFKMGSFATPDNPEPVLLASPGQVKARIRQRARDLKDSEFPRSLFVTAVIDNELITVTGTDKGDFKTKEYLLKLIQPEIDFQNGRLEKLLRKDKQRQEFLQQTSQDLTARRALLSEQMDSGSDSLALLALQQGIDNAASRQSGIRKELDQREMLNASDLYIDSTLIIQPPFIIASSDWYRPIIFGITGLIIGLALTLLIAIVAVFRVVGKSIQDVGKDEKESASPDSRKLKENVNEAAS